MEKALKWWSSLTEKQKRKLAEDEQWTTTEQITNEQILMIYNYKFEH